MSVAAHPFAAQLQLESGSIQPPIPHGNAPIFLVLVQLYRKSIELPWAKTKGQIYLFLLWIHRVLEFSLPLCNNSAVSPCHSQLTFLYAWISALPFMMQRERTVKYLISQHLLLVPHWDIAMETGEVWNKSECTHFSYFSAGTSKFTAV